MLFNNEYSVAAQPVVGMPVSRSMMNQLQLPGGVVGPLQALNQWVSAPVPLSSVLGLVPGVGPIQEPPTLQNDDTIVSDVLSFEIKVLAPGWPDFRDLNGYIDPVLGFVPLPYGGIYDTATTPVNLLQLSAIKITIRVWDFKTNQARQVSIIQDL